MRNRTETTILVLFVIVASALDAYFTLLHLEQGGTEANPVMRLALNRGTLFFVISKMALTACGCFFLVVTQSFRFGTLILRLIALGYALLLIYHFWLFCS